MTTGNRGERPGAARELTERISSWVRRSFGPLVMEPTGGRPSVPKQPAPGKGPATSPLQPKQGHRQTLAVPTDTIAPQEPVVAWPPRFGAGSPAAGLPWRLPDSSAGPSGLAADQAVVGDLHVRAASVVGAGHRCEPPATPRQDAYRLAQDRDGRYLVIAVADGLGASSRSELGAQVATGQAVAVIRRHLDAGRHPDEIVVTDLYLRIASSLVQSAEQRGLTPDDVRTTLTVAVVDTRPRPDGLRTLWLSRLGDCAAWYRISNGWEAMIGAAKSSFDGNTLSEFLPHYPEAVVQKTFTIGRGAVFAVMTDGVSDALAEVNGFGQWLRDRWAEPPQLTSFVLDVDFDAPGQQDDRTAVVVWTGRESDDQ